MPAVECVWTMQVVGWALPIVAAYLTGMLDHSPSRLCRGRVVNGAQRRLLRHGAGIVDCPYCEHTAGYMRLLMMLRENMTLTRRKCLTTTERPASLLHLDPGTVPFHSVIEVASLGRVTPFHGWRNLTASSTFIPKSGGSSQTVKTCTDQSIKLQLPRVYPLAFTPRLQTQTHDERPRLFRRASQYSRSNRRRQRLTQKIRVFLCAAKDGRRGEMRVGEQIRVGRSR